MMGCCACDAKLSASIARPIQYRSIRCMARSPISLGDQTSQLNDRGSCSGRHYSAPKNHLSAIRRCASRQSTQWSILARYAGYLIDHVCMPQRVPRSMMIEEGDLIAFIECSDLGFER